MVGLVASVEAAEAAAVTNPKCVCDCHLMTADALCGHVTRACADQLVAFHDYPHRDWVRISHNALDLVGGDQLQGHSVQPRQADAFGERVGVRPAPQLVARNETADRRRCGDGVPRRVGDI